jgi:hypothetical protein
MSGKRLMENLTMKELAHNLGIAHGTLKYWELHKLWSLNGRDRSPINDEFAASDGRGPF